MSFQFGMVVMTDLPLEEQRSAWKTLEDLGFDQIYVGDLSHSYGVVEIDGKQRIAATPGTFYEAWSVLVDMAARTERVRIGPLVASPILRSPVLLAMQAAALDQLSGGRLELAIGMGVAYDHAAMGVEHWRWEERAARYQEYVSLVDRLLRTREGTVEFKGEYYQTSQPALNPGCVQRPRLRIHTAGQSGTAIRVAAEIGDVWHGPARFNDTVDEAFERLRKRNEQLDRHCEKHGRDPGAVTRSLDLMELLDGFASPEVFEELVTRGAELGFTEFVGVLGHDHSPAVLERIATHVMPKLRG